jgi:hypothetical protein
VDQVDDHQQLERMAGQHEAAPFSNGTFPKGMLFFASAQLL